MGRESTLTIYRRYRSDRFRLDDASLKALHDKYVELNEGKEIKKFPEIVDLWKIKNLDMKTSDLDNIRNRYFTKDGCPVDEIMSDFWCSSFSELWEEYNLDGYSMSNYMIEIPLSDAKAIKQALAYLLSKNWNETFEDVLDNKWIKIFGEKYPKYTQAMSPNRSRIYIEKDTADSWSISSSDDDFLYEIKEENDTQESTMKSLLRIIDAYLLLKDDIMNEYNEIDYMLIYRVSG